MTKTILVGLILCLSACTDNHTVLDGSNSAGNATPSQAIPANPSVPAQSEQPCHMLDDPACSQRSDCRAFMGRKIVGGTKQAPTTDPESFLGCMPSNATCGASITCLVSPSGECYIANSECIVEGFGKCSDNHVCVPESCDTLGEAECAKQLDRCGQQQATWFEGDTPVFGFVGCVDKFRTCTGALTCAIDPNGRYALFSGGGPGCVPATYKEVRWGTAPCNELNQAVTCMHLSMNAATAVLDAVSNVRQCGSDADCTPIAVQNECWDSCITRDIAGVVDVQNAIDSVAQRVESICSRFHAQGCQVIPSGCPGRSVNDTLRCQQDQCVVL